MDELYELYFCYSSHVVININYNKLPMSSSCTIKAKNASASYQQTKYTEQNNSGATVSSLFLIMLKTATLTEKRHYTSNGHFGLLYNLYLKYSIQIFR
jgi:hypothetical protein